MKILNKVILVLSLSGLITACGGGGDSGGNGGGTVTPPVSSSKIEGVAIDGYVEGATAFLDYNFNNIMDEGEPRDVTDQNGRFDFKLADDNICKDYAPVVIDVPVGAYDSDFGPVTEPYQLSFPPAFATDHNGDLFATTPFTSIIWSAIVKDVLESGINNCEELANNVPMHGVIRSRVTAKEWEVSNRYNIPVTELYADFIQSGNTEQHELAQVLATGLAKGYSETTALIEANPGVPIAKVEYYVEKDSNGEWTKWFREEHIWSENHSSYRLHEVSSDLNTLIKILSSSDRVQSSAGEELDSFHSEIIGFIPEADKYACSISNEYKETRAASGDDIITFRVMASVMVNDIAECEDPAIYLTNQPYANVVRELYVPNSGKLLESGQWRFDYYADSYVDQLMNEGIFNGITDINKLVPFRNWDHTLGQTESYGADGWTRSLLESFAEYSTITDHNDLGVWMLRTFFNNGTYKIECGDALDNLVEVSSMDMCNSLPIQP